MGAVFLIFVCALVLWAAVCDIESLTIPNAIPVFVLAAFAVVVVFDPTYIGSLEGRLISASVLFVVTFFMFVLNLLGAGDSKLLATLGFWLPFSQLWSFVLVMAVTGAVLGIIAIGFRKLPVSFLQLSDASWVGQLRQGRSAVPYAVAIATAFIVTAFPW